MTKKNFNNGNIISLTLKNFQTFKSSTISFSPSLNFIIGPNGSGKSTISNAISLIFSGTPKTIGKSKNIKEYIRFGEHDCKIEAEVFYNNEIIKLGRGFSVANNFWFINGELIKKVDYDKFVNKLNVDINNLCQYLPQEKVSEFCRMTSEELLNSTLLSLKREDLLENIKFINSIELQLNEASSKEEALVKQKEEMEKIVEKIENDVEKIKERDEKVLKIDKLFSKKIFLEYDGLVKDYKRLDNSIKTLQRNYEENIKELESIDLQIQNIENNPKNILLNKKIEDLDKFDENLKVVLKSIFINKEKISFLEVDLEHLEKTKEQRQHDSKKLVHKIESNKEELEKIKQSILEKKEFFYFNDNEHNNFYKRNKLNQHENEYDNEHDNEYDNEHENEHNNYFENFIWKYTNLDSLFLKFDKSKINELEDKKYKLHKRRTEIDQKCFDIKREVDSLEDRKKKFLEAEERRLEQLKKYSYETYKGVMWLRENKKLFEEEIIEPPFLNIQISDERFLNEIEIFLSFYALTSFICKNQRDFEKLSKICKDEMKLGINIVEDIKIPPKVQYTNEQVKKLGFDGLVIDFIDTREEIKKFLMASCHLQNIPITKKSINENYIFENTSFKRMAAEDKYLEIKRSKYDNKDFVIICQSIKSKNIFSSKIDTSEIEKRLFECNELRLKYNEELKQVYNKSDKIEYELNKLYEKYKEHNNQIIKLKNLINSYKSITEQLKTINLELKKSEDLSDLIYKEQEVNKNKKEIKNKLEVNNNMIIKILKDPNYLLLLQESVFIYREIKTETNKLQGLLNSKNNIDRQNKIITTNILDQEKVKDKLKPEIKIKKDKKYSQEEMSNLPDVIEEINNLICTEKTQLQFFNVNENIKKEFESSKRNLEDLSETLQKIKNDKQIYNENIQIKKQHTKKEIINLIKKINIEFTNLFRKLNCDGEVKFENEGLCKEWKLIILVKFRENEKLEKLSSFRQSGGEKSVSTILFLLSLQKIDSSPFRLVDEINQGMDKINEKSILEMLFEICENDKNTQFFIISPKLVEGLKFSKSMRVIILFSDQSDKVKNAFYKNL